MLILLLCRKEDITKNKRVQVVLSEIRKRAGDKNVVKADGTSVVVPADVLKGWKVHIVSRNTFPTAAGLASSAAGYACLVHTLADVYAVKETYIGELSTIARQGSGSACRSLYGGFVEWQAGSKADGSDSQAIQVADEAHWPELVVLIAVVSDKKKDTGSTDGMTRSVATSALLAHRATSVVPARLAKIEAAYRAKDFPTFARCTMEDSNQFHATCLDTYPPVFYMNDVSRRLIGLVHRINGEEGHGPVPAGGAHIKVAYTFDAGPNAVLYTTKQHAPEVLAALLANFPASPDCDAPFVGNAGMEAAAQALIPTLPAHVAPSDKMPATPGAVRHVYVTSVGDGPRVLPQAQALADPVTGLPYVVADAAAAGEFDKAL